MCQRGYKKEQLEHLLYSIEELRSQLYKEVEQGRALIDPKVIEVSQNLDAKLNCLQKITSGKYNQILWAGITY